jgi:hypothetical protein
MLLLTDATYVRRFPCQICLRPVFASVTRNDLESEPRRKLKRAVVTFTILCSMHCLSACHEATLLLESSLETPFPQVFGVDDVVDLRGRT